MSEVRVLIGELDIIADLISKDIVINQYPKGIDLNAVGQTVFEALCRLSNLEYIEASNIDSGITVRPEMIKSQPAFQTDNPTSEEDRTLASVKGA